VKKRVPTNCEIADRLASIADLLEAQEANPHRVRSYRSAAQNIRDYDESIAECVRQDDHALEEIPGIGSSLAGLIAEYVRTGESQLLNRLQAQAPPEQRFAHVLGIGPELAERVARELGITSLEELEQAAHDGRLAAVKGFGAARVEGVKNALAGMLGTSAKRRADRRTTEQPASRDVPPVEVLLDVDAEYRRKAREDTLKKIAPKRFNPEGEAWLPILRTDRGPWRFTALFSNTARAHELGKTNDWVVLYFRKDGGPERQVTVVTGSKGALKGKRVVRGHEKECRRYYSADAE